MAIVAIPLVAFMPWSGTGEQEGIPPSAAEETPPLSPSPILTLAPETPEPEYIPDANEKPARTDTAYFHDYIYEKAEIRFVRGRLRFTDDEGNASDPAPFPSMVVIYNGERVKNE